MQVIVAKYEIGFFTLSAASPSTPDARIVCYDRDGKNCAVLDFIVTQPGTRQAFPSRVSDGVIYLTFPMERCSATIDLLRNESPIVISYGLPIGLVQTMREPVGEQEHGFGGSTATNLITTREMLRQRFTP